MLLQEFLETTSDRLPEKTALVSIFAILKADTVFVVLNPTLKSEKLAYILDNCRAAALITYSGKGALTGQ